MSRIINFTDLENNVLIWRASTEVIEYDTSVIVPHGSEAIFLLNGQLMEVFQPGLHQFINIKCWTDLFNGKKPKQCFFAKLFGYKKKPDFPFTYQIYYLNKTIALKTLWGTPNKIEFKEAETGLLVSVGARGQYKVLIDDTRKVYTKLVGARKNLTTEEVKEYFISELTIIVREELARILVRQGKSFFETVSNLKLLSMLMQDELNDLFSMYGFRIDSFTVDELLFPEEVKQMVAKYALEKYTYQEDKKIRDMKKSEIEEIKKEIKELDEHIHNREKYEREESRKDLKVVGEIFSDINKSRPAEIKGNKNYYIYCGVCGTTNEKDAKHCKQCGKEINYKKICKCGATISNDINYCKKCGEKV